MKKDGKEFMAIGKISTEKLMRPHYNPLTEREQKNVPWDQEWDKELDKHDWKKNPEGPKSYPRLEPWTEESESESAKNMDQPSGQEGNKEAGTKYDEGKSRVDLLDPDFLMAVGEVLRYGAEKKYNDHNWRGGISISRLIGSIFRHLFALCRGQDTDSESGLPHTAHLGCDVMFLHWMLKYRPDLDDRYKY